jgi:hypothetical protein
MPYETAGTAMIILGIITAVCGFLVETYRPPVKEVPVVAADKSRYPQYGPRIGTVLAEDTPAKVISVSENENIGLEGQESPSKFDPPQIVWAKYSKASIAAFNEKGIAVADGTLNDWGYGRQPITVLWYPKGTTPKEVK